MSEVISLFVEVGILSTSLIVTGRGKESNADRLYFNEGDSLESRDRSRNRKVLTVTEGKVVVVLGCSPVAYVFKN